MYDIDGFVKSHAKKEQIFFTEFCESSTFKNFIQDKYYNPNDESVKIIDLGLERI